jgi:hypothetical protein
MSSTRLDNSSLQAPHHDQQPLRIVVKLLAQGSVVVLVVAFGWWGMWKVGSSTLASKSDSLTAERYPVYVAGYPVPDRPRSVQREGVVLARAEAVLRKDQLTRSAPASREYD